MAGQDSEEDMFRDVFYSHVLDWDSVPYGIFRHAGVVSIWDECTKRGSGRRGNYFTENTSSRAASLNTEFSILCECGAPYERKAGGCVRERLCIVCESKRRVEVECVKTTWTAQYSASRSNNAVWLL